MKKALVLGATGGIGYALVKELLDRNVQVIAFARTKAKLQDLYQHDRNVSIMVGDVLIEKDVNRATEGVDVIFHAISFPYQEWEEKHITCIDIMIKAAKSHGAKIALVDNIYAYGKQTTIEIDEEAQKNPHTKKGKIRLEMENRLKGCHVPCLIVHLPDLYGPNAENTIFHETLKNVAQNKKANYVGDLTVAREFIFTFDAAKAVVKLAEREGTHTMQIGIFHQLTPSQAKKSLQYYVKK